MKNPSVDKHFIAQFIPVQTRVLIPFKKNRVLYVSECDEFGIFMGVDFGHDKVYLKYNGAHLLLSYTKVNGYELCKIVDVNGKRTYRLPRSMSDMSNSLLRITGSGFARQTYIFTVDVIEKGATPTTLLDRFIFNSADICSIGYDESDGIYTVKETGVDKSLLYKDDDLICERTFDFANNTCTFDYSLTCYQQLFHAAESYKCLNYNNEEINENFVIIKKELDASSEQTEQY